MTHDWIDFSENFRHPFTHITDVHLLFLGVCKKKFCQILVIFGLCQTSWNGCVCVCVCVCVGGGWSLSATPPKWLIIFQSKFQTSYHTYYRCAPLILFLVFLIFCQILPLFQLCRRGWHMPSYGWPYFLKKYLKPLGPLQWLCDMNWKMKFIFSRRHENYDHAAAM